MQIINIFHRTSKQHNFSSPLRPVIIYTVFGFFWIIFSDSLLVMMVKSPEVYQGIQIIKGWGFILITAALLYFVIAFENRKNYRLSEEITHKNLVLQDYADKAIAMEQALQDQLSRLNHMVYYDQLTGLRNRYSFEEDIQRYLMNGERFSVYYVDVDHFKNLNDIHGHYYGDAFLKQFGETLSDRFRRLQIYRWGGDEFIIIDPVNHGEDLYEAVQQILEETHRTWKIGEVSFHTSTSIGVVSCPEQGEDLSTIFKNLEVALYKAKEAGRARSVFFVQDYIDSIKRKSKIEHLINRALEEDGFHLNYQPIYDFHSRSAYRYEVLLRINVVNDLDTHIGEVIAVAEQTGHIHRIDDWVIEKVFSLINGQKEVLKDFKVSINISSQTFTSSSFISYLQKMIETYNVSPQDIEFEVTEHTIVKNIQESYEIMKGIKALGFMMALDDFGTRYSSLNYLSRLPFDVLKIDKSYVDNILNEGNDMIIVKQIIMLARAIGLITVAEGIETLEQEQVLQDAGCDYGQGYCFSKPMDFKRLCENFRDLVEIQ